MQEQNRHCICCRLLHTVGHIRSRALPDQLILHHSAQDRFDTPYRPLPSNMEMVHSSTRAILLRRMMMMKLIVFPIEQKTCFGTNVAPLPSKLLLRKTKRSEKRRTVSACRLNFESTDKENIWLQQRQITYLDNISPTR